jgi:hypothetical protein
MVSHAAKRTKWGCHGTPPTFGVIVAFRVTSITTEQWRGIGSVVILRQQRRNRRASEVAWHLFDTPLQITTVLHQIGASLLG